MIKTPLSVLCLSTVLFVGGNIAAQSRNCQLMAHFNPPQSSRFNDGWGYVEAATGREMAIVGATNGTHFVETTNPSKPVSKAFIAASRSGWRSSTWRDMKEFGGYCYIVTESGGGMQIVDLRKFDSPRYVKLWGTSYWRHAHNIAMDLEKGIAIVCGTGGSRGETIRFIDVKTNPESPKLIASWFGRYQHDLAMQHGLLHGSEIYAGNYSLYDVRNLNSIKLLGRVRTPRFFTHNTWPTYDDHYCVTTDERSNGPMAIYDISARGTPVYKAQYHAGPSSAIIHNAFTKDYLAHISHYTEGYRCVDISNPSSPQEVGFYDTWQGSSSGYNGSWGCYHRQPSGIIYAIDISTGLYILKPKATATRYGKATPGTGGAPVIHTIGSAYIGNASFKLGVRAARASSATVLVLGGKRANASIGGLIVNVELVNPPAILISSATNASGAALLPFPIPNDPGLNGLKIDSQFFVLDPAGKLGFSGTRGLEFEVFTK